VAVEIAKRGPDARGLVEDSSPELASGGGLQGDGRAPAAAGDDDGSRADDGARTEADAQVGVPRLDRGAVAAGPEAGDSPGRRPGDQVAVDGERAVYRGAELDAPGLLALLRLQAEQGI